MGNTTKAITLGFADSREVIAVQLSGGGIKLIQDASEYHPSVSINVYNHMMNDLQGFINEVNRLTPSQAAENIKNILASVCYIPECGSDLCELVTENGRKRSQQCRYSKRCAVEAHVQREIAKTIVPRLFKILRDASKIEAAMEGQENE